MQTIKGMNLSTVEDFVSKNAVECIDFADGCLIDNVVYSFPFGTMFCFEQYANEWSSNYVLYFFHKDRERGINKMWKRFNALKEGEET